MLSATFHPKCEFSIFYEAHNLRVSPKFYILKKFKFKWWPRHMAKLFVLQQNKYREKYRGKTDRYRTDHVENNNKWSV